MLCRVFFTSCAKDYSSYTVACIGDSITWGAEPKTGMQMDKPYPTVLKETLRFGHVSNYGVGSSTVCNGTNSYAPMVDRLTKIPTSVNIIVFWGGVNDWGHDCELGTYDSQDSSNLYGALYNVCKTLNEKYTNTFSMLMTPLPVRYEKTIYDLTSVKNAIIERGKQFNIPVLNMYDDSGFEEEWNQSYSDGLHPSQDFVNNRMVPKIANFIKANVKK